MTTKPDLCLLDARHLATLLHPQGPLLHVGVIGSLQLSRLFDVNLGLKQYHLMMQDFNKTFLQTNLLFRLGHFLPLCSYLPRRAWQPLPSVTTVQQVGRGRPGWPTQVRQKVPETQGPSVHSCIH